MIIVCPYCQPDNMGNHQSHCPMVQEVRTDPPKGYGYIYAPKGWECPKCGRVYSPSCLECYVCNNKTIS
jgi:hypothetical protein